MAKGDFFKNLRANTGALICLIISLLVFIPGLVLKVLPDLSDNLIAFYLLNIGLTFASLLASVIGIYLAGFQNKTLSGIFITLLAVWLGSFLVNVKAIESVELKTLDQRFSFRYQYIDQEKRLTPEESPIIIVDVSDQAGEEVRDRYPWPRTYYAHFIRNMKRAGAKVVGIDIVFDAPDYNGPEKDDD
ncbi:MAG TPA: CHASE2 domain-containing protein, partial [bacterium]|nr:CHASE2 domain-containing protein [bacterium]